MIIRKLMAICIIGMVITGSLWLVAEFAPMPPAHHVQLSQADLDEMSDLMKECLAELKRQQGGE